MKWDSHQFWLKSRTYQERAVDLARTQDERSLWRALGLEHLLRAALTSVHPALNADPQNEGLHLLYAFGFEIKGEARSIPIHAVTARLERIIPDFQKPHREFCDFMLLRRNEEMHACTLPFEHMSEGQWLPHYYEVCLILNGFLGHALDEYFSAEEVSTANQLVVARRSDKRGEIEHRVAVHRDGFERLGDEERLALGAAQTAAASTWDRPSTCTKCPSCASTARLIGVLERSSQPAFADGALVVEEQYLGNSLSCGACGLHLRDVEELLLAGIELHYTLTVHTDLHEFYSPEDIDPYMNM